MLHGMRCVARRQAGRASRARRGAQDESHGATVHVDATSGTPVAVEEAGLGDGSQDAADLASQPPGFLGTRTADRVEERRALHPCQSNAELGSGVTVRYLFKFFT